MSPSHPPTHMWSLGQESFHPPTAWFFKIYAKILSILNSFTVLYILHSRSEILHLKVSNSESTWLLPSFWPPWNRPTVPQAQRLLKRRSKDRRFEALPSRKDFGSWESPWTVTVARPATWWADDSNPRKRWKHVWILYNIYICISCTMMLDIYIFKACWS